MIVNLTQNLNDALNQQVAKEYHNLLFYKKVASWFEDQQLVNLAEYFHNQSDEEKGHASMFIDYINDRTGGKVTIQDAEIDNTSLNDLLEISKAYIELEEQTTISIEELFKLALDEGSYIDVPFLQEFLKIQVKEEIEANELSARMINTKDIYLFDQNFKA
jgi:ferritin